MGAWEMRWETRQANAVKDYEQKKKEGRVRPIDLTQRLDDEFGTQPPSKRS